MIHRFLQTLLQTLLEPLFLNFLDREEVVTEATGMILSSTVRILAKAQRDFLDDRHREAILPDETSLTYRWERNDQGHIRLEAIQKVPMVAENVRWISKRTSRTGWTDLRALVRLQTGKLIPLPLLPTVRQEVDETVTRLVRHKLDHPYVLESISP